MFRYHLLYLQCGVHSSSTHPKRLSFFILYGVSIYSNYRTVTISALSEPDSWSNPSQPRSPRFDQGHMLRYLFHHCHMCICLCCTEASKSQLTDIFVTLTPGTVCIVKMCKPKPSVTPNMLRKNANIYLQTLDDDDDDLLFTCMKCFYHDHPPPRGCQFLLCAILLIVDVDDVS